MDAKGQSILEVVIVLPFLFLFVGLLFKMNMGIQMAINNIQYSRSQVYALSENSPEYPKLALRRKDLAAQKSDLMVLGVADPQAIAEAQGGDMPPIPQIQKIARKGGVNGSEDPGEPSTRTDLRIRETSAICTQVNYVDAKIAYDPEGVRSLGASYWPFGHPVCGYQGGWIGDGQ